MKEFIDKLIERLEEEHERCINRYGIVGGNAPAMEVKQCIDIVNELAEEYKGGWIPVSERLPEDRKEKLVYLSSNRITIARYNDHRLPYSDYPIGWGFPAPYFYIDFEKETVVAWMPLPAPYTEGE